MNGMNDTREHPSEPAVKKSRFGLPQILGLVVLVVMATALVTAWWVKHYMYASTFTPTVLTSEERKVLDSKLAALDVTSTRDPRPPEAESRDKGASFEPKAYTEEGARREIRLTEKELNALIANTPEVAQRVAIDLSENLISVQLVVPVDEGVFILGGKTLRLHLGVMLGFERERPVVALKGVSLGGIPLPNAWLGNLKNRNLVSEFGDEEGFWRRFSDGVAGLKVQEGHMVITLKE